MNSKSETTLRGAVVGAGYFSHFHYDAWGRIDQATLIACCDLDPQKANEVAARYKIEHAFAEVDAMLASPDIAGESGLDFIDIVTGPATHRDLIDRVLSNITLHPNLTIICQKPLAPTFEESVELVRICRQAGVRLIVHENFRFQPWYREIRELIDSGVTGTKLHTISLRYRAGDGWGKDAYLNRQAYFRTMPRMLMFETGVHAVDTFRYLTGEVSRTFAHLRRLNPVIIGEDTATVLFEFEHGGMGLYDGNRYNESTVEDSRYTFGELLMEMDGGSIRSDLDGRVTVQPLGKPIVEHIYSPSRHGFAGDCVFAAQCHFTEVLLDPTLACETEGEAYLKTLAVQEAIYLSAETGQWQKPVPFKIDHR